MESGRGMHQTMSSHEPENKEYADKMIVALKTKQQNVPGGVEICFVSFSRPTLSVCVFFHFVPIAQRTSMNVNPTYPILDHAHSDPYKFNTFRSSEIEYMRSDIMASTLSNMPTCTHTYTHSMLWAFEQHNTGQP